MIHLKRAYGEHEPTDGCCLLVDRLWSRVVKKEDLALAGWLKEVAPSDELRRHFNHDPHKWPVFQRHYRDELDVNPEGWQPAYCSSRKRHVSLSL